MTCIRNSIETKLFSIIGYGTFITRGEWIGKSDVEVCIVRDFVRILPKGGWFPYVLPLKNYSFWALKFSVTYKELKGLDRYEGVDTGLFKRFEIEITFKKNRTDKAFIYIPTEKTINSQDLTPEIDTIDRWKDEIKKFPAVIKKFPELVL